MELDLVSNSRQDGKHYRERRYDGKRGAGNWDKDRDDDRNDKENHKGN